MADHKQCGVRSGSTLGFQDGFESAHTYVDAHFHFRPAIHQGGVGVSSKKKRTACIFCFMTSIFPKFAVAARFSRAGGYLRADDCEDTSFCEDTYFCKD